jgi:hypothetical protein
MLMTERLLHSVALAICEVVSDLLNIISWIISSFERGSLGAISSKDSVRIGMLGEVGFGGRNGQATTEYKEEPIHLLNPAHPSA